jgi:hypothetical protein
MFEKFNHKDTKTRRFFAEVYGESSAPFRFPLLFGVEVVYQHPVLTP